MIGFPGVVLLLIGISPPATSVPAVDVRVSPGGSDPGPGSKGRPLATLAKAREVARRALREHPDRGVTVWLDGGDFLLPEPFEPGPEDSGRAGAPSGYRAAFGRPRHIMADARGFARLVHGPRQAVPPVM